MPEIRVTIPRNGLAGQSRRYAEVTCRASATEKELEVLRTGAPVEGAAVWLGGCHTQEPEED